MRPGAGRGGARPPSGGRAPCPAGDDARWHGPWPSRRRRELHAPRRAGRAVHAASAAQRGAARDQA
ncbi:hypothetical protein D7Y23_11595, partial [Corallococcus sp. AB050B]